MMKTLLISRKGNGPVCDDNPLPPEMLDDHIAKYGEERTQGYIDAVRDFQKHFQRCFDGFTGNEDGIVFHQRPIGAKSMVKKLFHRNSALLISYGFKKFGLQSSKPK